MKSDEQFFPVVESDQTDGFSFVSDTSERTRVPVA